MTVAYYFSELFVFLIYCHGQLQNSWRIDNKLFEHNIQKESLVVYLFKQMPFLNQFTSGILYFFRSPVRDYFQ